MKHYLSCLIYLLLPVGLLVLVSCSTGQQVSPDTVISITPTSIPTSIAPAATIAPAPTPVFTVTPDEATPTEPSEPGLCSPLEGVEIDELPAMVANPFAPPPAGRDEPHQGVDIAQRDAQTQIGLEGLGVNAVLPGRVAAVIRDQFPYGNAVIIESLRSELPIGLVEILPSPAPTPVARSPLTCPQFDQIRDREPGRESLYILYAHLKEPASIQVGSLVSCGQMLGAIGSTGNALNPHLHLEARLGPVGTRFSGLGHYDSRATPEEMANYCEWRISGWYHLVDPIVILGLAP